MRRSSGPFLEGVGVPGLGGVPWGFFEAQELSFPAGRMTPTPRGIEPAQRRSRPRRSTRVAPCRKRCRPGSCTLRNHLSSSLVTPLRRNRLHRSNLRSRQVLLTRQDPRHSTCSRPIAISSLLLRMADWPFSCVHEASLLSRYPSTARTHPERGLRAPTRSASFLLTCCLWICLWIAPSPLPDQPRDLCARRYSLEDHG